MKLFNILVIGLAYATSFSAAVSYDWYLVRTGQVQWSAFDAVGTVNISMMYNTSKTASYTVKLTKSNCIDPVNSTVAWPVHQLYPYGAGLQYNGLRVDAFINATLVVNSPIWTASAINNTARVDLCARVDLRDSSGTSYNFHEQKLSVTIDLTQGFTVSGVIDIDRDTAAEAATDTSLDFGRSVLSICKCNENAQCSSDTPLVQGDALFMCINSTAPGVLVASIQSLYFYQAASQDATPVYNTSVIAAGAPTNVPTESTTVGTTVVVRIQLPSALFSPSNINLPLFGSGVVAISFGSDQARNLGIAIDNSVDRIGGSTSRRMQQDQTNEMTQTGFSIRIDLAPREMEEAPVPKGNTNMGAFIGGIVAAIAGVAIIVALVLAARRKKEDDKEVDTKSECQSIN
jgi:hypothetical protein